MPKKLFAVLIILAVIIAGFLFIQKQNKPDLEQKTQSPTLFNKNDYQIEDHVDGKYIVVEKAGLTAKVPDGWTIEIQGDDYPEPEYWVNLYSPDAQIETILKQGCGVSVMAGIAPDAVQDIKNNVALLQANLSADITAPADYEFEVAKIGNYQGVKWLSAQNETIGQFAGIDIPIEDDLLISFDTAFPPGYKETCLLIWEQFIKSVLIQ